MTRSTSAWEYRITAPARSFIPAPGLDRSRHHLQLHDCRCRYVNVATAGTNLTLLGQMNGVLNKTGPGTLTLASASSGVSGANILAGTLAISNASGMGLDSPTVNVMANSTFESGFTFGANPNSPLLTLNLNGGTMTAVAGNGGFYLNQIVSQAGGAIDLSERRIWRFISWISPQAWRGST